MKKLTFLLILILIVSNCDAPTLKPIVLFKCSYPYILLRTSNDCIDGEVNRILVTSDEASRIADIMKESPALTCISVVVTPKGGGASTQGWIYKSDTIIPSSFTYFDCTIPR